MLLQATSMRLPLVVILKYVDMLSCIQHAITIIYFPFFFSLACIFADQVVWQSGFIRIHSLIHAIFTSQFSLPLLPHMTHSSSPCPSRPSPQYLLVSQASPNPFRSADCADSESDRRCGTEWGWLARLSICQLSHHQFKFVAKALDSALVYLQWPLANPVLKTEVCRSPGSGSLQLNSFASEGECLFPQQMYTSHNTCKVYPILIDASMIMVASSVWVLTTPKAFWRVDISLSPSLVSRGRLESLARETTPPCLLSLLSLPLFLASHSPSSLNLNQMDY